jgi:hypothetical protein
VSPRVLLLLSLVSSAPALAQRAYVVASDQPAFTEAAKAAAQVLGAEGTVLRADDAAKAAIAGARVVVAVGPLAERLVGGAIASDAQAVACLMSRSASLPAARTVSVPLLPSLTEVMALVRTVLPTARKVGVFAAGGRPEADIADAARQSGLEALFPKNGEAFAAAVDRLVNAADVVFIEDVGAIPSGGAQLVVKKASDAHKQVVGPNRATVLNGALFAVVPDPVAHGVAAGEAAARLLRGEEVRSVPPPAGRIVINGALARTLGVKLPQTLAKRAETVE